LIAYTINDIITVPTIIMIFKQNYLKELPDDIQDKIYSLVNKNRFNVCLKNIDNPKIKLFHEFNNIIKDNSFLLIYAVYDLDELGWFWENHKSPYNGDYYSKLSYNEDEDEEEKNNEITCDLFEAHKRLSYKNYTKVYPEYKNIRYYKFKYDNNDNPYKEELLYINSYTKNNFVQNNKVYDTHLIIEKIIFTKKYIHIYLYNTLYDDSTPLDIAYNIFWAYEYIGDCLAFLNANPYIMSFDYAINNIETCNRLQHFHIKNNVVNTCFTNC